VLAPEAFAFVFVPLRIPSLFVLTPSQTIAKKRSMNDSAARAIRPVSAN
jgi:hypothetical protein